MEGDVFSRLKNGGGGGGGTGGTGGGGGGSGGGGGGGLQAVDGSGSRVMQNFQKSFVQVQSILDQNRLLINEINQNHESKIPDNLSRNVGLIRELNSNIRRVVDLYADLSLSFAASLDASSSDADSAGTKSALKRFRPPPA